jgi:hypothetical protein
MQPPILDDVTLAAMVVALVSLLRNRFPRIDGPEAVLGISALIAVGLCFLMGGDTPANLVRHGITIAIASVGGMAALKYHATKSGGTLVAGTLDSTSIPAPPPVPNIGGERGFASWPAMLWGTFAALLAILAIGAACSNVSKRDVKTVVDVAKDLIEEICTPEDRSLDACLDKVLSSREYARATRQFPRQPGGNELDGGR